MVAVPGSPGAPMTQADFPPCAPGTDALEVCAVCHPEAAVRLFYHQGVLVVRCQACEAVILYVRIAPAPDAREPSPGRD